MQISDVPTALPYTNQPCLIQGQQQMSILNNKKKRTGPSDETPSKVLLTCVYDTVVLDITNQIVFAKFSPFGTIVRILIFERGEVTKFFIEFTTVNSAVRAKTVLDGSKLYEAICKMNIYFSNFSSVDLKHQTTEGVAIDYYYPPDIYSNFLQEFPQITKEKKVPIFNSCVLLETNTQGFLDYLLVQQLNYDASNKENVFPSQIERTIQHDIDSLLRSQKKPSRSKECFLKNERPDNAECFLCFSIQQSIPNLKVYNLFSNFGNISYIKQTNSCIYIKYKSQQFVEIARSYLQGYTLSHNKLNFFLLSQVSKAHPLQSQFSEISYYDMAFDRFTLNKSITINPPSHTLHVSSLKREHCKVEVLRRAFERYGRVEKVQLLNHCADKNMALVKFASCEESFEAISEMHGKNFGGRKMQISFTKSKL